MSKQIRITLSELEIMLLTSVMQRERKTTIQSALQYIMGRFAAEYASLSLLDTLKEPKNQVPEAAEIEARFSALTSQPAEAPKKQRKPKPEPEPEVEQEPEPEPEPLEPIIPSYCDESPIDVDGREYFKTYELYCTLREKSYVIVDAVSFEDAIRAQDFKDNPPALNF